MQMASDSVQRMLETSKCIHFSILVKFQMIFRNGLYLKINPALTLQVMVDENPNYTCINRKIQLIS